MGIGVSIFLIALGLILALALDFDLAGVDITTIGWILVIVGVVGLVMAALLFGPRRRGVTRRDTVVDDRGHVTERRSDVEGI